MAHAQHDPILAATDVEDPEVSVPSAGGQRRRMLPIYSAVCLACFLMATLALTGFKTRSHLKFGGRVGLEEELSDDEVIWESTKGAAMIDQIQKELEDPDLSDEEKDKLEEKLDHLKEAIPDWEDIKNIYKEESAQKWEEIKAAVELEELEQAVEEAKAAGSDKLEELQEELEKAKAAVPSLDDIKQQASETWGEFADELPDLDDAREKLADLNEYMHDAVSGMVDSAFDWVGSWFE